MPAILGFILAHWGTIVKIVLGILGIYFATSVIGPIISGVQQAAPGIGAMVGSMGMMFVLLPPLFMMMMFMNMMAVLMRVFE